MEVIALRFAYVLALSVWFGGTILVGFVSTSVSDSTLHRYFLLSYASGGLVLLTLLAMALLGPRPAATAARFGTAAAMFASDVYAGRSLHALTPALLAVICAGGLMLLFLEARDATR